ncbi:phosphoserine phosphatase SerB [Pseudidiomarina sp.]|uniref:phosphoserine phosphatase SerB n=1 Tax=Pseudidiomarina sp. TaxID=2081707 RepID=UPI003A980E86
MLDFSKPGLAIFDMDSTLITIECIDEIAAIAGCKNEVSLITERAMRGELDFAESLKARVAALRGVRRAQLEQLFDPIPFTPGAQELLHWLHQKGWKTALVSGGFTWFAASVSKALKLDFCLANHLVWDNDMLTGDVDEPIVDARIKAECLERWASEANVPLHQTLAVGDGANDIPMLTAAGFGVAFCAKPALREIADLVIDEPDLMAIVRYFEQQTINTPSHAW